LGVVWRVKELITYRKFKNEVLSAHLSDESN
jgi:hypothetical protein